MAYDEKLAARIRKALEQKGPLTEKKMFGGLCFLDRGHMCCGVLKDELVLRLDPEAAAALLNEPHVRPMDFTGRPMRGFLYVGPEALRSDKELRRWVARSLNFLRDLPPKESPQKRPSKQRRKRPREAS